MDIKALLNLLASPTILALGGGWLGYKYGNKASINNKYVAGGVGVGAGYLLGRTLQQFTAPPPAVPQVVDTENPPMEDYLNLQLDGAPAPKQLPPAMDDDVWNAHAGEGSYGRSSYNTESIDEVMGEAEAMLAATKRGTN
jgi:hypothetical protein